jgi:hypothetical protein
MADRERSAPFTFQYPPPGPSSALEYMVSGLPFVVQVASTAGTATNVRFPYVTKFVTVKNNGPAPLAVGFTENGVLGTNKFTVPSGSSYTGDLRMIDIFFEGDATVELIAGLTQIPQKTFLILTGSHAAFSASQEAKALVWERGFGYNGLG